MLKKNLWIGLLLFFGSCQFFDTEKISSDVLYQDEIKTIDWQKVDRYPAFEHCQEELDKEVQKQCFISTLSTVLYQKLSQEIHVVHRDVQDTVWLHFSVDQKGILNIDTIKMDVLLEKDFPELKTGITESIDTLGKIYPAYKRGISVKTNFILPIILETQ